MVIDPGAKTVDLGSLSVPERDQLEMELDVQAGQPLAMTGAPLPAIAIVGGGLLLIGALFARRRLLR
jgi:LPXTG-motif cell wall-anchored protein